MDKLKGLILVIYKAIFKLFCFFFSIDKTMIIFESEKDFSDNTFALFEYMVNHNYIQNHHVVWAVNDVNVPEAKKYNIKLIKKTNYGFVFKKLYYMAKASFYIYDHVNIYQEYGKRKECTIVNLWHGCGIKGKKKENDIIRLFDYVLVTGHFYNSAFESFFNTTKDKIIDLGYPRNDYMFTISPEQKEKIVNYFELYKYKKAFLWMPTFRRSDNKKIDESYFDSYSGLPILYNKKDLVEFNDYLRENNAICIFKIHHLQSQLQVFIHEYSNVKLVKDEEIKKLGLQLYQFIPVFDCLISDYSSVVNDFFLLNKPIIFAIDDYQQYKDNRGFIIDNTDDYFLGYKAMNKKDFYEAIDAVCLNRDDFKKKREEMLPQMHTYVDGNSSQRIIDRFML